MAHILRQPGFFQEWKYFLKPVYKYNCFSSKQHVLINHSTKNSAFIEVGRVQLILVMLAVAWAGSTKSNKLLYKCIINKVIVSADEVPWEGISYCCITIILIPFVHHSNWGCCLVFKPRELFIMVLCLPVSGFVQIPQGLTKDKPKRQIIIHQCGITSIFRWICLQIWYSFPYLCSLFPKRNTLKHRKVNTLVL